jgi:hypothetical protein
MLAGMGLEVVVVSHGAAKPALHSLLEEFRG